MKIGCLRSGDLRTISEQSPGNEPLHCIGDPIPHVRDPAEAVRSKSQKPPRTGKFPGASSALRSVSSASNLYERGASTLQLKLPRHIANREWLSVADKGVFSSGLSSRADRSESDSSGPCLQDRLATGVLRTSDYFALNPALEPISEGEESEHE
ncbi:hypothetical protein FVE85_2931 [Porphyridium purpureum]|uniref:Uncharacterized protein n=1 Tax=Porphyridium purpureum TaxID=35688 RepID=A0A5J4YUR6_PORPP|nr:hypothetical protein FVE85_2931 [Porphyridium purpureum]|eukprot:POR3794..scf227_4